MWLYPNGLVSFVICTSTYLVHSSCLTRAIRVCLCAQPKYEAQIRINSIFLLSSFERMPMIIFGTIQWQSESIRPCHMSKHISCTFNLVVCTPDYVSLQVMSLTTPLVRWTFCSRDQRFTTWIMCCSDCPFHMLILEIHSLSCMASRIRHFFLLQMVKMEGALQTKQLWSIAKS
jgi:hypothetical protein